MRALSKPLRSGGDDSQVFDALVKRTLDVPLSIDIDFTGDISLDSVATIGQCVSRWRTLSLEHYASQAQTDITAFGLPLNGNLLEELDVTLRRDTNEDIGSVLEFFSHCPRLSSLHLNTESLTENEADSDSSSSDSDTEESTRRARISWTVHNRLFPLHQLTSMTLDIGIHTEEVLDVLRKTTQLESLALYNSWFSWFPGPDYEPVVLSHLKSLTCTSVHGFLLAICCPAIENLEMFQVTKESFLSFISRSHPPLHTLRIYAFTADWMDFDPSPVTGTIPRLELVASSYDLDGLRMPPSARPSEHIIPAKHISLIVKKPIDDLCGDTLSVGAILSFVKAHWRDPRTGLESFHLITHTEGRTGTDSEGRSGGAVKTSTLYQVLNIFRREGLKVLVSWSASSGMCFSPIARYVIILTCALQIPIVLLAESTTEK